jgi:hypothetical protein
MPLATTFKITEEMNIFKDYFMHSLRSLPNKCVQFAILLKITSKVNKFYYDSVSQSVHFVENICGW